MRAYWLPGISRYRLTKGEAKRQADVSPFSRADIPDGRQARVDLLNGMIEQHERTLAACDLAYLREEDKAKAMGYASLPQALEALRVLRASEVAP